MPGARPGELELMPPPQRAWTSTFLHDLLPPPRDPWRAVGATHVDELVASDRGQPGRDAAVLARGRIERAERVASRYGRLDVRPERTSLFQLASPPLGLVQDEARGPTTRAGRAAEWPRHSMGSYSMARGREP